MLAGQIDAPGMTVVVRAPAPGRVLRVPERSERVVAAGAPLIELGDPRSLEIVDIGGPAVYDRRGLLAAGDDPGPAGVGGESAVG